MAGVREYKFNSGVKTSQIPSGNSPTEDGEMVSLGYANENYTLKVYYGDSVASVAALKAVGSASRFDGQRRVITGIGTAGVTYQFNAASSSVGDDDLVIQPTSGTGRWLKASEGGGSSSGGGTAGIESLLQKLEAEKFHIISESLDNATGLSGIKKENQRNYAGSLLKTQAASDTDLYVGWNLKTFDESSPNMDSTTGWTAVGQGASLTASNTAGEFQVGTHGLKFDKGGSGTEAGIRYDRGGQTLQLNGNSRIFLWVKLPSITQLTDVYLKVYADSTSNYQKFTKTTDFLGNALVVGWNLILFTVDSGGSATGSGWDITKLSRYGEVGVDAVSAQTYTGIIMDGLFCSYYRPQDIGVIGTEFTLFNNSTKEDVVIEDTNTTSDGILSLVSALSNAYNGGPSGTAQARVQRSTMALDGDNAIPMDNNSAFSGAATLAQEFRMSIIARETVAGTLDAAIDLVGLQVYEVTTVGGSTIGVSDPGDQTANLKNGNTLDIFRAVRSDGKLIPILRKSAAMTADGTHSSGTTTLTVDPTGVVVGDIVVKRAITQFATHVGTETAQENFSAATLLTDPNGIQLIDNGLGYFNPEFLYAHYWVGGISSSDALRNRIVGGAGPALTMANTVSLAEAFQRGRFAALGEANTTDYLYIADPAAAVIDANAAKVQMSMWFYYPGTSGSGRAMLARHNGTNGYFLGLNSSSADLYLQVNGSATTGVTLSAGWYHIAIILNESGSNYFYLNGVKSSVVSATPGTSSQFFSVMSHSALSFQSAGLLAADLQIWKGGPTLTAVQALTLANGGGRVFREAGPGFMERLRYQVTGVSGQRFSGRGRIARTTTGITPVIHKSGLIVA